MTLNKAIEILMLAASRDVKGAGCGIRSSPSDAEKQRIKEAMERVWPRLYGYKMGDSGRFNMGV